MQTVRICGNELPLCLTVGALDRVAQEKGIHLAEIGTLYTTGEGRSIHECMGSSLWLLHVLMQEGREHARLHGQETPMPPPADMLPHLLTPGQVIHEIIPAIVATVNEGLGRTVEAQHEKNADSTAGSP